jgi:integrase
MGQHPMPPRRRIKQGQVLLARVMPLDEWPALDLAAWDAACRQASPLDPPGLAVNWAESTRHLAMSTWGRFLTYLSCNGDLDPGESPQQRLTMDRCTGFIASLRERLALITVDVAVSFLARVAAAMVPTADWRWVHRHPLRPSRKEVREARKAKSVPDPAELLAAALDHCDAADAEQPSLEQASRFRDGALVAFTVSVAVRRRNLVETRLGTNLILTGEGARLHYPTTKTGQPFDIVLTPMLTDVLRRYVLRHRPVLLATSGMATDRLWVAQRGEPMNEATMYNRFRATTRLFTGKRYSLHSARHALATSMMRGDPRALGVASAALGHRTPRTTRRAYDLSGADASNREWYRVAAKLRKGHRNGRP